MNLAEAQRWAEGTITVGAARNGRRPQLGPTPSVPKGGFEAWASQGVGAIDWPSFPEIAASIERFPSVLFAWGDVGALLGPSVAIVGTRAASAYGRAVAAKFAEALAKAGVTVVSGGALGIDAAAHNGALREGGRTVAVMAGGLDRLYPASHRELFRRIRGDGGCLISQFPLGATPERYNFLVRNATIAALSSAVLIVEAPERSGALTTAGAAAEFGRPTLVAPANIGATGFRGSHALIRDGATLVDHPDQVLEAIGIEPARSRAPKADLTAEAAAILKILGALLLTPEQVSERLGTPIPEVLSELTLMELDGLVMRDGPKYGARP